jgi:hypothetical protein
MATQHQNQLRLSASSSLLLPRIVLLVVLGYEAAGAVLGGILLIAAPDGRLMKMPVELMNGFFPDFLIPGIILTGLGILNGFAFYAVFRKTVNDWFMAGLAMGGFIIWFVVEIIILEELHWLHLMWGLPVMLGSMAAIPLIVRRNDTKTVQKGLLVCGILASLWYVAINIYVPMQDKAYSTASYTVSELSAIGAPTRILWVLLALAYPLFFSAFGWGVLQVAGEKRALRTVGWLILAYSVFNLYWPPMHMRGNAPALTDALHIVWAIITNIFMWLFMVLGAMALGKRFRMYTIISIILHIAFGSLTFREAPNIPQNGPTPTIGIWERINILIFMVWAIVFAVALLKRTKDLSAEHVETPTAQT